MNKDEVVALVAVIPDYPKPGVIFKDVTPISANPAAVNFINGVITQHFQNSRINKVVGVEARGFILGASLATHMNVGFVPIRKQGKLPRETFREEYELEYGVDAVEIHKDALDPGDRVLIVDDVLATGGTASAAAKLIETCGATPVGLAVLLNLDFLGGDAKLTSRYPQVDILAVLND
jgi:adenine phosphoribosyltransferase